MVFVYFFVLENKMQYYKLTHFLIILNFGILQNSVYKNYKDFMIQI